MAAPANTPTTARRTPSRIAGEGSRLGGGRASGGAEGSTTFKGGTPDGTGWLADGDEGFCDPGAGWDGKTGICMRV